MLTISFFYKQEIYMMSYQSRGRGQNSQLTNSANVNKPLNTDTCGPSIGKISNRAQEDRQVGMQYDMIDLELDASTAVWFQQFRQHWNLGNHWM